MIATRCMCHKRCVLWTIVTVCVITNHSWNSNFSVANIWFFIFHSLRKVIACAPTMCSKQFAYWLELSLIIWCLRKVTTSLKQRKWQVQWLILTQHFTFSNLVKCIQGPKKLILSKPSSWNTPCVGQERNRGDYQETAVQ